MNIISNRVTSYVKPFLLMRNISISCSRHKDKFQDLIHPEGREPSIPHYVEREGENIDLKRARLTYQSRKRGMLENGLLLSTFAKKYLNTFNDKQLRLYDHLINLPSNDWDIFYWATGVKPTPPEFDNEVMDLLKKHIQNENREARIMQPDL
ncbi:succinate dehydrogenase assembly factor 2, mitochondrial [Harpegnathos saltator]|nr:succinate dehydrogenase assembly factor 2, mitochondrial [Harpegnathos saltator]XP_011150456.1 succinate dehydrogenase assembly factor 2, mitochondrial [Harpegnathos saltator]XP_011150457.1 succinate dehydrogenase assembly factor 2, mitochondrial [Harpegnathos saltator]